MIFKGLFDYKNQTFKIKWGVIMPILFLIFIALVKWSINANSPNAEIGVVFTAFSSNKLIRQRYVLCYKFLYICIHLD